MDSSVVFRCVVGRDVAIFSMPNTSTFNDLCDIIRSKFPLLASGDIDVKYVLPGADPCMLCNDEDMRFMFLFRPIASIEFVELVVSSMALTNVQTDMVIPDVDPQFNPQADFDIQANAGTKVFLCEAWKTCISHVNQCFPGGVSEFRLEFGKYCIAVGFEARFKKNIWNRVTAVCSKSDSEGCEWFVHAVLRRSDGSFIIKKLVNKHMCSGRMMGRKSKMVRSKIVASVIADKVEAEHSVSAKEVTKRMKREYGITIPYWNACYAKEMACREVHGDDDKSYKDLARYIELLEQTNHGSQCSLEVEPETYRFSRVFIAIGGCIDGFMRCRPLLCLDATFLKGKFKGTLMAATALNGNQGIYPLCFAVVDSENSDNWSWFMGKLANILRPQCRVVPIILDRNKGLKDAVRRTFPTWPHAFCLFHIKNNIRSKFPGNKNNDTREKVLDLFTKCAYACRVSSFNRLMADLRSAGGGDIDDFLRDLPNKNWANAHFPGQHYGELSSNVAESFNSWLLRERTLPITQLVDGIRIKMVELMAERRMKSTGWASVLCPKMETILEAYDKKTCDWLVRQSSDLIFEVVEKGKYSVNLGDCTCSCEKWRVLGFSCAHVFTVTKQMGWSIYDYVDPYFRTDVFRECYSFPIYPVPSIDDDYSVGNDEFYARPLATKKQPGRPRNSQFKSNGESSQRTMTCGRCGQMGRHNRRTCSATI